MAAAADFDHPGLVIGVVRSATTTPRDLRGMSVNGQHHFNARDTSQMLCELPLLQSDRGVNQRPIVRFTANPKDIRNLEHVKTKSISLRPEASMGTDPACDDALEPDCLGPAGNWRFGSVDVLPQRSDIPAGHRALVRSTDSPIVRDVHVGAGVLA